MSDLPWQWAESRWQLAELVWQWVESGWSVDPSSGFLLLLSPVVQMKRDVWSCDLHVDLVYNCRCYVISGQYGGDDDSGVWE